jgi:hypothetical protein
MSWYDPTSWDSDTWSKVGGALGGLPGYIGGWAMSDSGGNAPPNGLDNVNLPYFQQDRDRLGGMLNGQSAFAGSEWGGLISQLQARANGGGPSVAGNAYKQASQDAMNNLASMSQNSASPGAARQALLQQGRIQQGMAQGYGAQAMQEQQANQSALSQALSARDQINSQAYQGILGQQLGLSRGQLAAMQGNQQFWLKNQELQNQMQAAKYQALSGLLAAGGKLARPGG